MANRAETTGSRLVELAENRRPRGATVYAGESEPSLPAALEKLASASQGVVTKRIDLVMLEIHELVGTLVVRSGLVVFGVLVALAAWFTALAALVLYLAPASGSVVQLGIFALINAALGAGVITFAVREKLPQLGTEAEVEEEARRRTPQ